MLFSRAGCGMRSIFKQSNAALNSEFSFPYTGCQTKIKQSNLPNFLAIITFQL